jgi:type 1 glutamine amidotransferase
MKYRLLIIVLVIASFGAAACGGPSTAADPDPIQALLITGGGWHDFEAQKHILTEGIAERANVEWTIDHEAGDAADAKISRHETTEWAREFDVVVYNMSFSYVTDVEWIERIVSAHREYSVPAVVIHGSVHSYRRSDTDAYRELIGVASYEHDSHRPYTVENLQPEHPVMQPFPEAWETPNGELYEIEEVWPTVDVLARAWSEESEEYHPVIWTNELPGVNVFGTTIGHHNETMEHSVFLDMVTRGLLWTLDRLEEDGTPVSGYGPTDGS